MTFDIRGAKAQMPVSADEINFIEEYEIDMGYAGVHEYSDFTRLTDAEKLNWIKMNDTKAYNYFLTHIERFA